MNSSAGGLVSPSLSQKMCMELEMELPPVDCRPLHNNKIQNLTEYSHRSSATTLVKLERKKEAPI